MCVNVFVLNSWLQRGRRQSNTVLERIQVYKYLLVIKVIHASIIPCCITNYPKIQQQETQACILSRCVRVRNWTPQLGGAASSEGWTGAGDLPLLPGLSAGGHGFLLTAREEAGASHDASRTWPHAHFHPCFIESFILVVVDVTLSVLCVLIYLRYSSHHRTCSLHTSPSGQPPPKGPLWERACWMKCGRILKPSRHPLGSAQKHKGRAQNPSTLPV